MAPVIPAALVEIAPLISAAAGVAGVTLAATQDGPDIGAPPPVEAPPERASEDVQRTARQRAVALASRRGRQATILTSPLGETTSLAGTSTLGQASILG